MAQKIIAVSENTGRGADLDFVEIDPGDVVLIKNDGHMGFIVRNPTGVSVTINLEVADVYDGFIHIPPLSEVLASGEQYFFGRIPLKYNKADGMVSFTCDGACELAAFSVAPV
jgi:hypothetical protein